MIREFQGEYRWLSNFWPCKITLDGMTYNSVEHAYMSAKSDDIEWKKFCQSTYSLGQVKKASRSLRVKDNWNDIKLQVMKECIDQKFSQEPLKSMLINTGDIHIQEGNMWNDKFWGVCLKTGKGENFLGKIIMQKRNKLIKNG